MQDIRLITSDEVKEVLTMPKAIDAMRQAFMDLSSGEAQVPDRLPLHTSQSDYLFMPAYYSSGGITTIKSVSINAENPKRGLPFIHALINVFENETGKPLAIVDGTEITAIRTAAASGLATQIFSNPDARVGAIFGTGVQAKTHVEAILSVRKLDKILIFGSSLAKSKDFCEGYQPNCDVDLVATEEGHSLLEADVICTVTTSSSPVFKDGFIKKGAHINAVGVFKPDCHEIPIETVAAADVYIDQLEGALAEAGDLLIPMSKGLINQEHFSKEIGAVINGDLSYRWSENKTTLFKSVGNAIQDAAAVAVLLTN
ncbi:MAG: hypothetical protein RJQ09_15485 [Cyclobacteriaceae bacterium]